MILFGNAGIGQPGRQTAQHFKLSLTFRVALSNHRIVGVVNDQVTFRYRVADTTTTQTGTLPAEVFITAFCNMCGPKAA